jgi:hypothetical protein
MMALTALLLAIGGLIGLVAWVWLVVLAFRTSIGWGLLILLLGWTVIPIIIFAVHHWDEARRPLVLCGIGVVVWLAAAGLAALGFGIELESVVPGGDSTRRRGTSTVVDDNVLPPPRPTAQPTHPSWEAVVREMQRDPVGWETFVPSPTPVTGRPRAGALSWDQLESNLGRSVVIELENNTDVTATLEAVEPQRIRVRHVIGGGVAAYWIDRDQIRLIRVTH